MVFFIDFYSAIQDFVETGGQVLLIIGILIFIMWLMILERIFYYTRKHQQEKQRVLQKWKARDDKSSWNAEQIRQAMISRVSIALGGPLPILQALVALCPLLGLMGTVTGMIEVFDVLAVAVRAMRDRWPLASPRQLSQLWLVWSARYPAFLPPPGYNVQPSVSVSNLKIAC